jgi:8-oxo-dGTP pyrophosphatase MutT (NUDIX family)
MVMTSKSKQRASARAARADAAAARTVIEVGAGIIQQHGKYLVSQRPEGSILGQCWEFPGGKREPGETIEECVVREIHEELRIKVKVSKLWRVVERASRAHRPPPLLLCAIGQERRAISRQPSAGSCPASTRTTSSASGPGHHQGAGAEEPQAAAGRSFVTGRIRTVSRSGG